MDIEEKLTEWDSEAWDHWDVFVSYAHADLGRVVPIADALRAQGLRVWRDDDEIADFTSITRSIADGLAHAKALVVYYSATYPLRLGCQWELTAALLAAQRDGSRHQRVLVVNPEPGTAHIHPVELREAKLRPAPAADDPGALDALAVSVARHVRRLKGTFGELDGLHPPRWISRQHTGSTRFVDRLTDLWRLHSALQASAFAPVTRMTGPAVAQVRGLGGIGKSLLTVEYALRFGGAYPGGVFWLQALGSHSTSERLDPETQHATLVSELRGIADALGLSLPDVTLDVLRGAIARTMEDHGQACLWVVDDLPAGLDSDAMRWWLAPHPLAATLITTRSTEYHGVGQHLDLEVLPPREAYQLLTTHRRPMGAAEQAAARKLTTDLGGHALAIDVAGAALKVQIGLLSFAEFRDALQDLTHDELEFASELVGVLPNGHERSIAATLLRSIGELGPEGIDMLRLASVLAVAPIPSKLVADVLQVVDELDHRAAKEHVARGLHQIVSHSLAAGTDDPEGSWQVHALVSRTVRFLERSSARQRALRAVAIQVLGTELAEVVEDLRMHRSTRNRMRHARELIDHSTIERLPELKLLSVVARYDTISGEYHSAKLLYRRLVHAAHRLLGNDHPTTLSIRRNFAQALHRLGDLRNAKALLEQAVAGFEAMAEPNRSDLASALNDLGLVLRDLGDLAGAEARFQRALGIDRFIYGPQHAKVATVLNNIGMIQREFGRPQAAASFYRQALEINEHVYGEQDLHLADTLNNLGVVLGDLGKHSAAKELLERALEIEEDAYGEHHPEVAATLSNLALALRQLGDLTTARGHLQRALDISRMVFGVDHPEVAFLLGKLAVLEQELGELDAARADFQRALRILEGTDQEVRPEVASLLSSFGSFLRATGDLEAAKATYERALVIRQRIYGPDDHIAGRLLAVLGEVAYQLDDLSAARENFSQALAVLGRTTEGASTREQVTTLGDLSATLLNVELLSEAQKACELALTLSETLPDDEADPRTSTLLYNNLGAVLRALGRHHEAHAALETALAFHDEAEGMDPLLTARLFNNLGQTLRLIDDPTGARAALQHALDAYEAARTSGDIDMEIAGAHYQLGSVHFVLGDPAGARDQLERAYSMEVAIYGADHPTVATTLLVLGATHGLLGNLSQATAVLQQALRIREEAHGPESYEVFRVLCELVLVLNQAGEVRSLRSACERALSLVPSMPSVDVSTREFLTRTLGIACQALGDLPAAKAAYEEALELHRRTPELDRTDLWVLHNNLGSLLSDLDDRHGALEQFRTAERLLVEHHGPSHPRVDRLRYYIRQLQPDV